MTWVPVVIVGLVIALAVGPVMMAMPSKRQSYLAGLRKKAQELGFHIQLTSIDSGSNSERLAAYRLLWDDKQKVVAWRVLRKGYVHEMHFCGEWAWDGDEGVNVPASLLGWLQSNLPDLPDQIRAVGADSAGVTLYWREQGGADALDKLFQTATALKQSIIAAVGRSA